MAAAATRAVSTLASLQTAHATLQESIQEALEAQQQFLEHLAESTDGKAAADENRQAMVSIAASTRVLSEAACSNTFGAGFWGALGAVWLDTQ